MFVYIFTGISIICTGIYVWKPSLIYNTSIFLIRNVLWIKQLKKKYIDEKISIIHKEEIEIDNFKIHEFSYKMNDIDKNYTYKYTLKYIGENKDNIQKYIKEKLYNINELEKLNSEFNQILHCNFYWKDDPDTILDLTTDIRYFVLHFDCEETTIYKFIKYIIHDYDLNVDLEDYDNCGLFLIKNDDSFSEIKISINDAKFMNFKEIIKTNKS